MCSKKEKSIIKNLIIFFLFSLYGLKILNTSFEGFLSILIFNNERKILQKNRSKKN